MPDNISCLVSLNLLVGSVCQAAVVIEGIALAMSVVVLMVPGLIAFWLILYRFYPTLLLAGA